MGRRRQVSDRQISVAAREVFLDRGPKAPVAMIAKKLGVSTATLFQRTGSKQQLMLMAFQPEGAPVTELDRGLQPGVPVREQLGHVLIEINQYLGAIISASITLRAACIESNLPEPTPYQLRTRLAG
jgi:AcrR family transcriptional regulator